MPWMSWIAKLLVRDSQENTRQSFASSVTYLPEPPGTQVHLIIKMAADALYHHYISICCACRLWKTPLN
eukprot:7467504-Heterocapsa_arctica.AAC.1